MFKRYKINMLIEEIKDAHAHLVHQLKNSQSFEDNMFLDISTGKTDRLTWSQVAATQESQTILFQVLLHRQWLGYLAETVRQKRVKLLRLQGDKFGDSEYTCKIENASAKDEMAILLQRFTEEMVVLLEDRNRPLQE